MSRPFHERLLDIELLLLDVDGVLTDGRVTYSDAGEELQSYHIRDGSGIAMWRRSGKRVAAITGRGSKALERRAAELGIDPLLQHAVDKAAALTALVSLCNIEPYRIAAVGDDLPDLPVLRRVGAAFAVADACAEVKAVAGYVTKTPGGNGAVREVVEIILNAQGRWHDLVASFES
jgi:3-deoxy-D-manno-octulosonate 8-phosphate phosphatase (KDO 8-P phosphatase)